MQTRISSASIDGMEAKVVDVEVATSSGLPKIEIIGLGDQAVKEAAARVKSAIHSEGREFPRGRVIINLAPAWLRKRGSHFDLAIAIGIMSCTGQVFDDGLKDCGFIGELALDGTLSRCKGVLQMVRALRDEGSKRIVVPIGNVEEASLVSDVEIIGAKSLSQVLDYLNLKNTNINIRNNTSIGKRGCWNPKDYLDYRDVKGQEPAKRAIIIAAAGGHNIIMKGSPGTGKTMLAERIPSILPALTEEEILDITAVYSVAGMLDDSVQIMEKRPFRAPGMSVSVPGLLGSGSPPRPGEISLAHKGVLFMDEMGERHRDLIDALRIPMEAKQVIIQRMGTTYKYPADFMFVAATNLCKCGGFGDPRKECTCTTGELQAYQSKISGPMLGRIDMHVELMSPEYIGYSEGKVLESADMRKSVIKCRKIQRNRYGSEAILNASLRGKDIDIFCILSAEAEVFLRQAYDRYKMEPRGVSKLKKLARTIADLDESMLIEVKHIAEAIQYREKSYVR